MSNASTAPLAAPGTTTPVNGAKPLGSHRAILPDGGVAAASIHGLSLSGDPGAFTLQSGRFFGPVDLFTGGVDHTELQISLAAHVGWPVGIAYGDIPAISGGSAAVSQGVQGPGWFQMSRPELVTSGGSIYLVQSPTEFVEFQPVDPNQTTGTRVWYKAANGAAGLLSVETAATTQNPVPTTPDVITIFDLGGRTARFFGFGDFAVPSLSLSSTAKDRLKGQLWRIEDAAGKAAALGNATTAAGAIQTGVWLSGSLEGLPLSATDSAGRTFAYSYSWPDGTNQPPRLAGVTATDPGTGGQPPLIVSSVTYTYSTGFAATDGKADLVRVNVSTLVSEAGATPSYLVRSSLYRYDSAHRLTGVVSGEGARRYLLAAGASATLASPGTVVSWPYADFELSRDASGRVSGFLTGGIGNATGSPYTHTVLYGTPLAATDLSQPLRATAVQWPAPSGIGSGPLHTTTFNAIGQPLLAVIQAGTSSWINEIGRDSKGRVSMIASPAAHVGGLNTSTLLASPASQTGLTLWVERFPDTGASPAQAAGAVRGIRRGAGATAADRSTANWLSSRDLSYRSWSPTGTPVPALRQIIDRTWSYQDASTTVATSGAAVPGASATRYTVEWWETSDVASPLYITPSALKVTDPVVPTAQNGLGQELYTQSWFDRSGDTVATRARTGRLDALRRSLATGLVELSVVDAKAASLNNAADCDLPSRAKGAPIVAEAFGDMGTTVPDADRGYNRRTLNVRDRLGRVVQETGPDGYSSQAYYLVSGNNTLLTISVPLVESGSFKGASPIIEYGHDGQVLASGKINPNPNFKPSMDPQNLQGFMADPYPATTTAPTAWVTSTGGSLRQMIAGTVGFSHYGEVDYTLDGSRPISARVYPDLAASSQPQFQPSTAFGFDIWGRTNLVIDPSGTRERVEFDIRGLPVARYRSTGDGSNEVLLASVMYDNGAAGGNGLPTELRQYRSNQANDFEATTIAYNALGLPRSVSVPNTGAGAIIGVDRNNQDQVIGMAIFDKAMLPGGLPAGTSVVDLTTGRKWLETVDLDILGRGYRSTKFHIDPDTGIASATGGECNIRTGAPMETSGGASVVREVFRGRGGNVTMVRGEDIQINTYDRTCSPAGSVRMEMVASDNSPSSAAASPQTRITEQQTVYRDRRTGEPRVVISATAGAVMPSGGLYNASSAVAYDTQGVPQTVSLNPASGVTSNVTIHRTSPLGAPSETLQFNNITRCDGSSTPLNYCAGVNCNNIEPTPCKKTENRVDEWLVFCGGIRVDGRHLFQQFNGAGQVVSECEKLVDLAMVIPILPGSLPEGDENCPGKQKIYKYDNALRLTDIISIKSPTCTTGGSAGNAPQDITLQQLRYPNSPGTPPTSAVPGGFSTPNNNLPRAVVQPSESPAGRTYSVDYDNLGRTIAARSPRGDLFQSTYAPGGRLLQTVETPANAALASVGLPTLPVRQTNFGYDTLGRPTSVVGQESASPATADTVSMRYNSFGRMCDIRQKTPLTPFGGPGTVTSNPSGFFDNEIRNLFTNPSRNTGNAIGRRDVAMRVNIMDDTPASPSSQPVQPVFFGRIPIPAENNPSPVKLKEPNGFDICACNSIIMPAPGNVDYKEDTSWQYHYNGTVYPPLDLKSPKSGCSTAKPWEGGTDPNTLSPNMPANLKFGTASAVPVDGCSGGENFDILLPSSGTLEYSAPPTGPPQAPANARPVLGNGQPSNDTFRGMYNPPVKYNALQRDSSGNIERVFSPDRAYGQGVLPAYAEDKNYGRDCDGNLIFCGTGAHAPGQSGPVQESGSPPPPSLVVPNPIRQEWAVKDRRGNITTKADLRTPGPLSFDSGGNLTRDVTGSDLLLKQVFGSDADQATESKRLYRSGGVTTSSPQDPRWDANGNLIDDGYRFIYQYDARNRMVGVFRRWINESGNPYPGYQYARFSYNGLGWRTAAVYDLNENETFDDDTIEYYGYNESWQLVRIDRQGPVITEGSNAGLRPPVRRYQAIGYLSGEMAAKYATDRPIVRLRDTDGDGIYDEKLSYIQNWRGDVVALVKRVAKLDAMTADAAERKWIDPKAELPESTQVTYPITPSTWTGTDAVSTAIRAALERQGYKLSSLEAAGGTELPPLDVPGRGMVVERYSYGLYGDPDTQAFADTARTNLLVSQDAIDKHAEVFSWSIDYIGTDGLRGDLRADVDGDGIISSWDQLRFAQQQTAWAMIYIDQLAANSDEAIDGWSTLGQLSRPHPVGMKPTGEPLDAGTVSQPGARDLHKLRGVVQLDNRLGYAGYVWDPFLQMYHVRHRVLNPRLGIWMQPDPIGYAGGWNLHEYCGGDPLARVDPSGLDWLDNIVNLGAGIGDGMSLGLTTLIRQATGLNDAVDSRSATYGVGVGVGTAVTVIATAGAVAPEVIATRGGVLLTGLAIGATSETIVQNTQILQGARDSLNPLRIIGMGIVGAALNVIGDAIAGPIFGVLERAAARVAARVTSRGSSAVEQCAARALANRGTRVGPEFDPEKLQAILKAWHDEGGATLLGEEGLRLARSQGGNALYWPTPGGPGTLVFGPNPTRLEVIEELIHLAQYRKAGWPSTDGAEALRNQFEREAQDILLNLARRQNWTQEEIEKILFNRAQWYSQP